MTGWIVVIAFLIAPLACWAMLARTRVLGWAFAAVLAAYAVAEGAQLTGGWPFRDEPAWMLIALPVLTVVALATGAALEEHEIKAAGGGPGWTARRAAGAIMAVFYSAAILLGAFAIMSVIATGPGL